MTVVAGPPGSGKSSRFPLSSFHIDWFNADERAAELNSGSFHMIQFVPRRTSNSSKGFSTTFGLARALRSRQRFAVPSHLSRRGCEHAFWTAMEYVSGSQARKNDRFRERGRTRHL